MQARSPHSVAFPGPPKRLNPRSSSCPPATQMPHQKPHTIMGAQQRTQPPRSWSAWGASSTPQGMQQRWIGAHLQGMSRRRGLLRIRCFWRCCIRRLLMTWLGAPASISSATGHGQSCSKVRRVAGRLRVPGGRSGLVMRVYGLGEWWYSLLSFRSVRLSCFRRLILIPRNACKF